MAFVRGGRDVESVHWFNKYCKNGACIDDEGQFCTDTIMVHTVKHSSMNYIVRGFEHVLMMIGLAWFGFPVLGKGMVTYMFKQSLVDIDKTDLHTCVEGMCKQYKTFMTENIPDTPEKPKREEEISDACEKHKACSCTACLLKRFFNTQVVVCEIKSHEDDTSSSALSLKTVREFLQEFARDQWCFWGQGFEEMDYSNWDLHTNLCYAHNSHEVVTLALKTYSIVYGEEFDFKTSNFAEFSSTMLQFCQSMHDGKSVSALLNEHLSKTVKKCRESFYKSKYEIRMRFIYCVIWNVIGKEVLMKESIAYLLSEVLTKKNFDEKFENLYNDYGHKVLGVAEEDTLVSFLRPTRHKRKRSVEEEEECDTPLHELTYRRADESSHPTPEKNTTGHLHLPASSEGQDSEVGLVAVGGEFVKCTVCGYFPNFCSCIHN